LYLYKKRQIIDSSLPEISVILPFYNAESTIERALSSIANQTFRDFECILINNNSIDKSEIIAKNWQRNDSRFKVLYEKRQGVVFASNKGAQYAGGKYITRMDADDEMHPEKLKLQADFLNKHPDFSAVASLVEYISHDLKRTKGFRRYVNWNNSVRTYTELIKSQFIEMPLVNPTCMWRKTAGDKFGLYRNGDFPEDYEMWLRWFHKGAKICKLPLPLLKWYDSENRLTRTKSIYSNEAFYKIKTKYLAKWLNKNNPFYPNVVVWGASKTSRRRAILLKKEMININAYIDIKGNRQIDKKIIYFKDIAPPGKYFILVYIKLVKARKQIVEYLTEKGYTEGIDFLLVS
jgi:glycosyltransferase involved in cell wall biosynthesis